MPEQSTRSLDEDRPARGGDAAARRRWARWLLVLLPPIVVGMVLRFWGLGGQVIWGDEVHAVRTALAWDLPKILTTYRVTDNCIPLTAYLRLLVLTGRPLTELAVRLPSIVAGLVTLVAVPPVAARAVGRRSALVFAWAIALSPSLAFYSRIARPYAVVALLGQLALVCFWRWWEGEVGSRRRDWGWVIGYAVSAAAAAWFHPGAGPFVAAPLAYAAGDLGARRLAGSRCGHGGSGTRRPGLARLVAAGTLLGLCFAAFLVPAAGTFLEVLRKKADGRPIVLETADGVGLLFAGTPSPWIAICFWLITGAGLALLWRRRRRLALFTLCPVLALVAALLVMEPYGVRVPVICGRYLLIALPSYLLWFSFGLVRLWDGFGSGRPAGEGGRSGVRWAGAVLGAGVVAALVVTNPYLSDPALRLGPCAASDAAIGFDLPSPLLPDQMVPAAYRMLRREPGAGAVVAIQPKPYNGSARLEIALWRVHRRPLVLGTLEPWIFDPRLAFSTRVGAKPADLLGSSARFVALDLDRRRRWEVEEEVLRGRAPQPESAEQRHARLTAGRRLDHSLRAAWGPPQLTSGTVLVWDLAVVRGARSAKRAAALRAARTAGSGATAGGAGTRR